MKFRIYRYDPEQDAAPRMQDYDVALDPHDRMLLDALIRVKAHDDTLAFRRSCLDGVPVVLVEPGQVRGPGRAPRRVSVHRRLSRSGDGRAPGRSRGPLPAVPLSHDHELRRRLPEGAQSDQGDRQDQGDHGEAGG